MRNQRRGFTLVELLVATALIMFVMAILSQAFMTSLELFSQLKGLGDMEEGLRAATQALRKDLTRDHFTGKKRLSDPNFWDEPIPEGFFHIRQVTASSLEGRDQDNLDSHVARNNVLHFTNKNRGNRREHFPATLVPWTVPHPSPFLPLPNGQVLNPLLRNPNSTTFFEQANDGRFQDDVPQPPPPNILTGPPNPHPSYPYTSPWEEVGYFLLPTGTTPNGTPLYALYRFQTVMLPRNTQINEFPPVGVTGTPIGTNNRTDPTKPGFPPNQCEEYPGISCVPYPNPPGGLPAPKLDPRLIGKIYFTTPAELALRQNIGSRTLNTFSVPVTRRGTRGAIPLGSGLVLSNVISFNVRVLSEDLRPIPGISGTAPLRASGYSVLGDFTDIDTYPFANIYPATWDSTTTTITDVKVDPTNANQTLIQSPGHGLTKANVGQPIYIKGVRGYTNANTDTGWSPTQPVWTLTYIVDVRNNDTFVINRPGASIAPYTGNSTYTGGGFWSLSPIFRIKALQITLRVWDTKTQQSLQTTMMLDM